MSKLKEKVASLRTTINHIDTRPTSKQRLDNSVAKAKQALEQITDLLSDIVNAQEPEEKEASASQ